MFLFSSFVPYIIVYHKFTLFTIRYPTDARCPPAVSIILKFVPQGMTTREYRTRILNVIRHLIMPPGFSRSFKKPSICRPNRILFRFGFVNRSVHINRVFDTFPFIFKRFIQLQLSFLKLLLMFFLIFYLLVMSTRSASDAIIKSAPLINICSPRRPALMLTRFIVFTDISK